MTKRKGTVWTEEDYATLRQVWATHSADPPRRRAVIVSQATQRPVEGILTKAREIGLSMVWHGSRGHSGEPVGQVSQDSYRLASPEAKWKAAWLKAHGRRSYGSGEIRV